jgi:hypothetical protein
VAGVGGGEEDTREHNRCGCAMRTTTTKRDLKPTAQKLKTSDKICTVFGRTLTKHRKNPRCISVFRFPNCPGSVLFLFFLSPAAPHLHAMPGEHPPDTLQVSQQMFSKEILCNAMPLAMGIIRIGSTFDLALLGPGPLYQ